MDNKLDRETVVGFKQGCQKAFQKVYYVYYAIIKTFVSNKIGSMAESDDITSRIFEALYRLHRQFKDEKHIRKFLFRCADNGVINYWKYKQIQYIRLIELGRRLNDDTLLNNEYIKVDVLAAVHKAIEGLPEQCKRIFKMLFYEEITPAEVADILQISVSTVYEQKRRALKQLRIKFDKDGL